MNTIKDIRENFDNRVKSPFVWSFIISWTIRNWNIIYSAFFIDQNLIKEKYNLLRIEYLKYLIQDQWRLYNVIYPLLSVIFIFYVMPYIEEIINKKSKKNNETLETINREYLFKLESANQELLKEQEKTLTQKENLIKRQKTLTEADKALKAQYITQILSTQSNKYDKNHLDILSIEELEQIKNYNL